MGNHPSATPVGFQAKEEVEGRCLIVVMCGPSTRLCFIFHSGLLSAVVGFCAFSGLLFSDRTKQDRLKTGMPEIHADLMIYSSLNEWMWVNKLTKCVYNKNTLKWRKWWHLKQVKCPTHWRKKWTCNRSFAFLSMSDSERKRVPPCEWHICWLTR